MTTQAAMVACFLNARGDHLLSLPALRALADACRRRGDRFVLVARRGYSGIFFRDVRADLVVEVDAVYHEDAYRFDTTRVLRDLLDQRPATTFVSLNPWHGADLEQLVDGLRPDVSIGFAPYFDVALPLDFRRHSSDLAFDVVRALDPQAALEPWATPPMLPPDAVATAVTLRRALGDRLLLVVHPDSKEAKGWTREAWTALVDDWLARHPRGVVFDVGLGDGLLWSRCSAEDRILAGLGLELGDALAVVAAADRFVGVDSCFLHAADLARVPSIGLFGPTDPHEFGFRWAPHRHLVAPDLVALPGAAAIEALVELERDSGHGGASSVEAVASGRATAEGTERYAAACAEAAPGHFRSGLGLRLSSIGLGTARFGFERDVLAVESLLIALRNGCNVIDVAANHGGGDGVALVGHALRRAFWSGAVTRDSVLICSKAGFLEHLPPFERGRVATTGDHDLSPRYLDWELEQQRRLLGLDTLDAFLLQNPEEVLAAQGRLALERTLKEAFDFLEEAAHAGRIGWYGISTAEALRVPRGDALAIDLDEVLAWAESVAGPRHHCRVIELPVNVLLREALEVSAHGRNRPATAALTYGAEKGLLMLASRALDGGGTEQLHSVSEQLGELVPHLDDDGARVLQVTRSLPGVTVALVGATRPDHARSLATVIATPPLMLDAEYLGGPESCSAQRA